MATEELQHALNRVAGTTNLDAQGAANVWAGSSGLDLLGALNKKAGTTGVGMLGVLGLLANRFQNGSFETSATGWSDPSNNATLALDNAVAFVGTQSLRATCTNGSGTATYGFTSESVAAPEGATIKASVWVRTSTTRQVELYLSPLTAGGAEVNRQGVGTPTVTANTWTKLTGVGVMSPGGVRFYMRINCRNAALSEQTWIDSATAQCSGVPLGVNAAAAALF